MTDERNLNVRVPSDLYMRFRLATIEDRTTMSDVILEAIEQYLIARTQHKADDSSSSS